MSSSNAKRKREDGDDGDGAAGTIRHEGVLSVSVDELKKTSAIQQIIAPMPPPPASSSTEPPAKKPAIITTGLTQSVVKKPLKKDAKSPAAPSANQPKEGASFIDEIINESNDLLQAAREAQCLGRLRASSSYLLLAHARLVGLGRRFDRSRCLEDEAVGVVTKTPDNNANENDEKQTTQTSIILPPMPVAQNALPDVALMEHLARSGMELHHKRTGRGMQHISQMEKMANTPKVGKTAAATTAATKDKETPKRKGGRGKKPPTLVMHTLLGAELDAKKLMNIHPNV
eukprot:scaffold6050_cov70-Cyclotella_meneghiniana.AAC.5